jgi:hypothetical protein
VEGWEIPGRYLRFLRGAPAADLAEVVRHNDQDVRSLGRLLAHLEVGLGDPARRSEAPPGDLAGLARSFSREHRLGEALDCLDAAAERAVEAIPRRATAPGVPSRHGAGDEPWWSPRRPADFGGRVPRPPATTPDRTASFDAPWTTERIAVDRAHLLRRLGRHLDAVDAWTALAAGSGRTAVVAAIELAKLHEHRLRDRPSALMAVQRGLGTIERRRRLGRPEPALEADLLRRAGRLRRRLGMHSGAKEGVRLVGIADRF